MKKSWSTCNLTLRFIKTIYSRCRSPPLTYVLFVTKSSAYTTQSGWGFYMNKEDAGSIDTSVPLTFVLYLPIDTEMNWRFRIWRDSTENNSQSR